MKYLVTFLKLMALIIALLGTVDTVNAQVSNDYQNGITAMGNGDFPKAIQAFSNGIQKKPQAAYLYTFRGMCYNQEEEYQKALKDFTKAIELEPHEPTSYHNRGLTHYKMGNYQKCIEDCNKSIEFDPTSLKVLINRGGAYLALEKYELALNDFNTVLKSEPNNENAAIGKHAAETHIAQRKIQAYKEAQKERQTQLTQDTTYLKPTKSIQRVSRDTSYTVGERIVTVVKDTSYTLGGETISKPITYTTNGEATNNKDLIADNPAPPSSPPSLDPSTPHTANIYWVTPDIDLLDGKTYTANAQNIWIKLKIKASFPIEKSKITLLINDKPYNPKFGEVSLKGGKKEKEYSYTFIKEVQLLETKDHINDIRIVLKEDESTFSSENLAVKFTPGKPILHILSIGTQPINLQFTQNDATDFANLFRNQKGEEDNKLFAEVNIETLIGEQATSIEIEGLLEEYQYTQDIKEKDVLILFISSHGFMLNKQFRIQGNEYSPLRKKSTSLAYASITENLAAINCKKLIFIDACHSGGAKGGAASVFNKAIETLNLPQNGITTITSSSESQLSYEDPAWENGAFTEAIIKGLANAEADSNKDYIISVNELYQYLRIAVPKLVKPIKNEIQTPHMTRSELGDLPIFSVVK